MAREPFNRIWTETPTVDDFDEPTNTMWDEGWRGGADQDPPEAYAQNWWQNRADFALQDIERFGAMSYEATAEYEIGGRAIGSDGKRYRSIASGNVGNDPVTDGGINWVEDPDLSLATPSETATGTLDDHAVTPLGLLTGMIGTGNISNKGHIKIPVNVSGARLEFIVQWSASSGGSPNQTFDIQFPNAVLNIQITDAGSSAAYGTTSITTSGFSVLSDHPEDTYQWLAIGY